MLSGGLNQNNAEEAIRTVSPQAIDISSGVEKTRGIKDSNKIFNFIQMRHFDQFVFDMRGAWDAIHFNDICRSTDQHITDTTLADIAATMIGGKTLDQQGRKIIFPIHKNQIVGNKYILKNDL